MTVSKIDNKNNKNDKSKEVISEAQINMVLDTLFNTSDYHRVFIFCDAEIKKLSANETTEYNEFKSTGFALPQEEEEDKIWYPSGLNRNCFSSVAASCEYMRVNNSLCGSIEIYLAM